MKRIDAAAKTLGQLRDRGVRVAIDDFGIGYASLSYLCKIPVDALKIDQSFVRDVHQQGDVTPIVAAVIGVAKNLRLRVVAEGVETAEELTFLQDHLCDEAQGYYFSRPLPGDQIAELLRVTTPYPRMESLAVA